MADNKTYVPMPKGLKLPENAKDGDTVELLTEYRVDGSRLCVVGIEGASMNPEGEDDSEPDGDEGGGDGESKFAAAYNNAMGGGGGDDDGDEG